MNNSGSGNTNTGGGNINPGTGGGSSLENPLKAQDIIQFLVQIIDILLTFALPIIVLFIMYGGFILVTAKGNPGDLEKGRNAILWSVIGGVIVLAAKLIINVIQGTVTALGA
jgi:hypothetical protein